MKKLFYYYIIILTFIVGLALPSFSFAQGESGQENNKVEFTLFHSETCPHCKEEIKFIEKKLKPIYSQYVDFQLYEIGEPKNQELFEQYGYFYKVDVRGVPLTFIDGIPVHGFGNEKTTGAEIIKIIEKKINERGLNGGEEQVAGEEDIISIPILGDINVKTFSLPVLTLVIGLLDGFNPCAMWVLLFLISLLLGMENKKRMWLLGSIFIFASGAVYFFFMAAWLHFLMFIGMILLVRILVGAVAIGVGGKNIWDYWQNRKAEGVVCKVSKNEGAKNTFDKIKDIVYRKSLWWSILGILILGFSVNLVELACSAGFPAIFTQILSMSGLPMWQKYLYMAGYIVFYMLDDMIVFFVAMATLKSKVFGTKYAKYTNLFAGLMILILGILLIFKPEWLMFS
ncbi:hypothetical protein KJ785_03720 [Patescibacteria group bacterium]|nr:hypothetical protein [Patescibacteria group bacterium]